MEQAIIAGIAHDTSEAKVTILGVPDRPGIAARVFRPLADAGVNIDMIVQNVSRRWPHRHLVHAPEGRPERAQPALEQVAPRRRRAGRGDRRRHCAGVAGRRGHEDASRRRRGHVRCAGRRRHQHRDHLHLADSHLVRRPRRGDRARGAASSMSASGSPTRRSIARNDRRTAPSEAGSQWPWWVPPARWAARSCASSRSATWASPSWCRSPRRARPVAVLTPPRTRSVAVVAISPESFDGVDVALFDTPGRGFPRMGADRGWAREPSWSTTRPPGAWTPTCRSSCPRSTPMRRCDRPKGIIASPNCTMLTLVVPLARAPSRAGVRRVIMSSYQAASGAGQAGADELVEQMGSSPASPTWWARAWDARRSLAGVCSHIRWQ